MTSRISDAMRIFTPHFLTVGAITAPAIALMKSTAGKIPTILATIIIHAPTNNAAPGGTHMRERWKFAAMFLFAGAIRFVVTPQKEEVFTLALKTTYAAGVLLATEYCTRKIAKKIGCNERSSMLGSSYGFISCALASLSSVSILKTSLIGGIIGGAIAGSFALIESMTD